MGESIVKRRLMPLAAIGVSVLTMAGCRACGFADSQSFVFGCPPETPSPKLAPAHYSDVPNTKQNRLKIVASCVNNVSGTESAPLQINKGSEGFKFTEEGEKQYEFTVSYSVDISAPPATVESIELDDPAQPDAGVITMRGMYRLDNISNPQPVSVSR